MGSIWATWTDPLGTVWPLSDLTPERGYFTTPSIAGWGATTYELITDPMARGGESVRYVRAQPARLTWPLHVWGDTHTEFLTRYRDLKRAFMMTLHRGVPGTLTVTRPDGSGREIECFCEDGWRGEPGENHTFANPVLTLFCPEGAWRDVEAVVEFREYGEPVSFLDPFPSVSSSQIIGDTTIDNPGDMTAWPEWTITGPATSVTATNVTADHTFTLTYTLLLGETITVTTGGNRPGVRGPAGENLASALNWPTAYLWGLAPEDNEIEFSVGGADTGTSITMTFHPLYEGA